MANRWSVNQTWLMYGSIRGLCHTRRSIIRSKIKNCWITVRYIRLTLSRKEWTRLVVGSLPCMLSLPWYLTVCPTKLLSLTVWYSIRTVTRCLSVWITLSIRLLRLKSMVPTRCVGTWLPILLHGITWNLTLKEWKRFAVNSSVPYIIRIHSLRFMRM